ncbi:MAG: DUF3014 domain-containing protein [Burkholderiaceae bacterium]
MHKTTQWLIAIALLIAAAIGVYFWQVNNLPEPKPETTAEEPIPAADVVAEAETEVDTKAEPAIRYPVQENVTALAEPKTLPVLNASDPVLWDALIDLFGQTPVKNLFRPQEIVRHIVVTVDNLPRQTTATRLLPVKPVSGKFLTTEPAQSRVIAPENAARYTPYVRLAEMADAKKITAIYVQFYPLFQRAYQDLGYPNGYFNDRLIAVIDHLLAAPEADAPLALVQPHILYKFADPALEARSAGEKILLRMGSDNAARIKIKLREIRAELIGGIPKSKQPA